MKKNKKYETFEECLAATQARLAGLDEPKKPTGGEVIKFTPPAPTTEEEKLENEIREAFISEVANAAKTKGLNKKRLARLSGVNRATIKRIEIGKTSPRIDTMIKILTPLGKTIAIVPLEEE